MRAARRRPACSGSQRDRRPRCAAVPAAGSAAAHPAGRPRWRRRRSWPGPGPQAAPGSWDWPGTCGRSAAGNTGECPARSRSGTGCRQTTSPAAQPPADCSPRRRTAPAALQNRWQTARSWPEPGRDWPRGSAPPADRAERPPAPDVPAGSPPCAAGPGGQPASRRRPPAPAVPGPGPRLSGHPAPAGGSLGERSRSCSPWVCVILGCIRSVRLRQNADNAD